MDQRPRFSKEIAEEAAAEIVGELIRSGHLDESQRADATSDIVRHAGMHDDGYAIAKTLDRYAHWDCDFQMCETLDGFEIGRAHV